MFLHNFAALHKMQVMTIRGKEIDLSAIPVARLLVAQDLKGIVALTFFAAYVLSALLV